MQRENRIEPLQLRSPYDIDDTNGNGRASTYESDAFRPFIVRTRMADVEPEQVRWLWPERFPLGKLSLLVGDPCLGKSFLTLDVAARVSKGTAWPDRRDEPGEPGNVLLLSAEDDPGDTIRPRLDAAGADVTRIHVIDGVCRKQTDEAPAYFSLACDLHELEACIVDTEARLLILDPISAYLDGKDSHRNSDIRGLLGPLTGLAARCGCAILAVTHMNKSGSMRALYRAQGNIAFVASGRAAWLVAKDPDDRPRRLLLPLKTNLAANPTGLAFRIIDGALEWDPGPVDIDPDQILAAENVPDRTERDEVKEWLEQLLIRGSLPAKQVEDAARSEGYAMRTVHRAKKTLGVHTNREGFGAGGRYVWELPSEETHGAP